jgi:hypothetical protein
MFTTDASVILFPIIPFCAGIWFVILLDLLTDPSGKAPSRHGSENRSKPRVINRTHEQ